MTPESHKYDMLLREAAHLSFLCSSEAAKYQIIGPPSRRGSTWTCLVGFLGDGSSRDLDLPHL